MIIFTLDALADDSHRRHFVDPCKNPNIVHGISPSARTGGVMIMRDYDKNTGEIWQPDWRAFYDACYKDEPFKPVIKVFSDLKNRFAEKSDVVIWSGRCESVKEMTEIWIYNNIQGMCQYDLDTMLKLRPIGDDRPQEQLFELWKNDFLSEPCGYQRSIDMVFSSHKPTINMFRKCRVFVFDCNQNLI